MTRGSNKKLPWRCQHDHSWEATVNNRTRLGGGCPVCSGHKVLPGVNDLPTTHPALAAEANGWDPTGISAGSKTKRSWRCASGHVWDAVVADRKKGSGCHTCSGYKVVPGLNDLATTHPAVATEAFCWDPTKVSRGSDDVKAWRCVLGHIWNSKVSKRTDGSGCPICGNKVVVPGYNDLATTNPAVAAEADGWDPTKLTAGSARRVSWRCANGHTSEARIYSRAVDGHGCPKCSGHMAEAGVNDLATTHPDLAAQAAGWDPTTLKAASNKRMRWRCAEGHEWDAIVFSRARDGRGCPQCWGRYVTPGVNDLASLFPLLAAEVIDRDPTTLHHGTKEKVWWRCATDPTHTWETAVSTRTRRLASGCPGCATTGFDVTKDGWLYLVSHDAWGLLQIGITNNPERRIGQHESRGWRLLDVCGPLDGAEARMREKRILAALSDSGAVTTPEAIAGRFDGYTESWIAASFSADSLEHLVRLVPGHETEPLTSGE